MVFWWKLTSRRFFGTGSKYGFSPTGGKPGRWARRSRPGLCGQRSSGRGGRAAVVFASAVSQDPFLGALRAAEIDWTRVTAFHMDEYAGISGEHPASFRRFLRGGLFGPIGRA